MKKLQSAIHCKYLHFEKLNKTRCDGISSTKKKITGWASAGTALIAGGATLSVAGPFGWGIFLSEAGTPLLTAIATGSVVGGAGLGAGITRIISSFLPNNWFRNRFIETAVEAEESAGTTVRATVSHYFQ